MHVVWDKGKASPWRYLVGIHLVGGVKKDPFY